VNLWRLTPTPVTSGNQAFIFIGGGAFSGTAGELRLSADGSGNFVASGDVNGDGIADFKILFATPGVAVTQADFVL
jgi:hypothetical protein